MALFGDEVDGFFDDGEHAESEEVDFDHAGVIDAVFVPVAEVAVGPGGGLAGDVVDERLGGDDHAADVLGHVAGEAGQLLGEGDEVLPGAGLGTVGEFGLAGEFVGELVDALVGAGALRESL